MLRHLERAWHIERTPEAASEEHSGMLHRAQCHLAVQNMSVPPGSPEHVAQTHMYGDAYRHACSGTRFTTGEAGPKSSGTEVPSSTSLVPSSGVAKMHSAASATYTAKYRSSTIVRADSTARCGPWRILQALDHIDVAHESAAAANIYATTYATYIQHTCNIHITCNTPCNHVCSTCDQTYRCADHW